MPMSPLADGYLVARHQVAALCTLHPQTQRSKWHPGNRAQLSG